MRRSRASKACSRISGRMRAAVGGLARLNQMQQLHRRAGAGLAEHADRQIAKATVLGDHGQEGFDIAGMEAVADQEAVGVARLQITRRRLDAQHADHAALFADRNAESGIAARRGRPRPRSRHRADRSPVLPEARGRRSRGMAARRNTLACRLRTRSADDNAGRDGLRRGVGGNRQGFAIVQRVAIRDAGDHRNDRYRGRNVLVERLRERFIAGCACVEHNGGRLGRGDRGRCLGSVASTSGKAPGGRQGVDQFRRRIFGDDDKRALQCHGG